jgi:putative intracellular protease/amidase
MRKRHFIIGLLALPIVLLAAGSAWILTLPEPAAAAAAPPPDPLEREAMVASLKPKKRARPLVAIVGLNHSTETTDYLVPNGILRRADVADVVALATSRGPVQLFPALRVLPDATIAEFDARHPQGADYVVVPAMNPYDDPTVLSWIRGQAKKGAIVIGVCAGATVVANSGLLDGRRATTHWYFLKGMLEKHPSIRYVADRRFVSDRGVVTTTGISASMPMMLILIEAIAGPEKARSVARDLGVDHWDARHSSRRFALTRPFALTVLRNRLPFWNHESFGIPLAPGVDEVTLALTADAWSRTYRSQARTFASTSAARRSRSGIQILPDIVAQEWPAERQLQVAGAARPAIALDRALDTIAKRYGRGTRDVVAMQLEYHPTH